MTAETAQLMNLSGETTQVNLSVAEFTEKQKMGRALKRLALFWAIAVPCILLPFVHFVLVPGFVIAGIYVFVKTIKQDKLILKATGPCPSCKNNISFENLKYENEIKEVCPSCRQDLKVILPASTGNSEKAF